MDVCFSIMRKRKIQYLIFAQPSRQQDNAAAHSANYVDRFPSVCWNRGLSSSRQCDPTCLPLGSNQGTVKANTFIPYLDNALGHYLAKLAT
jgi:hypothetical protein